MKNIQLVAVIGLFGILTGCSSTKIQHLTADEFLQQAKQIEVMSSACGTTYIGCTHNRAYLEFMTVVTSFKKTPSYTVYWTELDGLPEDIAEQLKSGNLPWTPWNEKN